MLLRIPKAMELLTPDEIVRWSPPDSLSLMAQLWDGFEQEQLPLTSAQQAELDRRLNCLDQDRSDDVIWAALDMGCIEG
jgi:putative addiction module component (TIGR02574 family)